MLFHSFQLSCLFGELAMVLLWMSACLCKFQIISVGAYHLLHNLLIFLFAEDIFVPYIWVVLIM